MATVGTYKGLKNLDFAQANAASAATCAARLQTSFTNLNNGPLGPDA